VTLPRHQILKKKVYWQFKESILDIKLLGNIDVSIQQHVDYQYTAVLPVISKENMNLKWISSKLSVIWRQDKKTS
jgi:hypothetical protein